MGTSVYKIIDGKNIVDWGDDVIANLHSQGRRGLELKLMAICFAYCTEGEVPVIKFEYKDNDGKYRKFQAKKNGKTTAEVTIESDGRWRQKKFTTSVAVRNIYEFMVTTKQCNALYPFD
jgi:hypothetical protein